MSNNGDTVSIRSEMKAGLWARVAREASRKPELWVAQQRFEPLPMKSPIGPVYPCLGVYTINGRAAGAYGRFAAKPVIDYSAIDAAVLVANDGPGSPFGKL